MDKRFFVPSRNRHYKIPEDKLAEFMRVNPDAVPAEAGKMLAAPLAAPAAPAATPAAAPAPAEEGGMMRNLAALATGAGRGLTADFLDEIAGAAAAAGAKFGGEGVAPEFLAQEDFYAQGREEEQARQAALAKESPLLTLGGQIVGSLPYAAMAPTGAATFAGRVAQAAPSAAAYGAATGVGRTDILGTPDTAKETAAELAKNVGVDVGAGLLGAAGGAALGATASRAREYIARQLADVDKARVLTAGEAALEEAAKPGKPGVEETARYMRATGMRGAMMSPEDLARRASEVENESGQIIGRIVSEVDAMYGGLMARSQSLRTQADQIVGADPVAAQSLYAQADQIASEAAKRTVSGKSVADSMRSSAEELRLAQGGTLTDPISEKTYRDLLRYADKIESGGNITLAQAQDKLKKLAVAAKYDKGATDLKVPAAAQAARAQSRAIRQTQVAAATEAFPAGTMPSPGPYAKIGRGAPITTDPTGGEALQSTRRAYQVAELIKKSAGEEAKRISNMPSSKILAKISQSYGPSLKAALTEKTKSMAPNLSTALLSPQERILASLPYGAESFADMLRQIDEESRP